MHPGHPRRDAGGTLLGYRPCARIETTAFTCTSFFVYPSLSDKARPFSRNVACLRRSYGSTHRRKPRSNPPAARPGAVTPIQVYRTQPIGLAVWYLFRGQPIPRIGPNPPTVWRPRPGARLLQSHFSSRPLQRGPFTAQATLRPAALSLIRPAAHPDGRTGSLTISAGVDGPDGRANQNRPVCHAYGRP